MQIATSHPMMEDILSDWKEHVGDNCVGYRGHVYRMFNYCLVLRPCSQEEQTKLAITACFHDIGLWSDDTVDYIPPSIAQAKHYLAETGRESWPEEVPGWGLITGQLALAQEYR